MVWAAYSRLMARRPLVTSCATSGLLMYCGDLAAQLGEQKRQGKLYQLDWSRSLVTTSWNAFVFAPLFLYWFRGLDKLFPGSSFTAAASKVAINQLVLVVPLNAGFLAYTLTMENLFAPQRGSLKRVLNRQAKDERDADVACRMEETESVRRRSWVEVREDIRARIVRKLSDELVDVFATSCMVWVPTNMLNFMFVPAHLRVLPTVFVSFLWNTFLSTAAHRPPRESTN